MFYFTNYDKNTTMSEKKTIEGCKIPHNLSWDKYINMILVTHLAKRDNKGCVPNIHHKILPFQE